MSFFAEKETRSATPTRNWVNYMLSRLSSDSGNTSSASSKIIKIRERKVFSDPRGTLNVFFFFVSNGAHARNCQDAILKNIERAIIARYRNLDLIIVSCIITIRRIFFVYTTTCASLGREKLMRIYNQNKVNDFES